MSRKTISAPQLWIVLARSQRALSQLVERSIAGAGLCMSDFMVIEALLHKGPLTITEIHQKVLLALGSMTAAIDRLENKGLIVRNATSADRRAKVLQLTPEGRRLATEAYQAHSADIERVMAVLDEGEMQQIYAPLRKLGLFAAETLDEQKRTIIKERE